MIENERKQIIAVFKHYIYRDTCIRLRYVETIKLIISFLNLFYHRVCTLLCSLSLLLR